MSDRRIPKTYHEKLRHPMWQKMRLLILERDGWKCLFCGDDNSNLQVHHLEYIRGRTPWEYAQDNFKTLCESCHLMCREPSDKAWFKGYIMDRHAFGTLTSAAVTYYFGVHLLGAL